MGTRIPTQGLSPSFSGPAGACPAPCHRVCSPEGSLPWSRGVPTCSYTHQAARAGMLSLVRLSRSGAGRGTWTAVAVLVGNPILRQDGRSRGDATGLRSWPEIPGEQATMPGQPARCCQSPQPRHKRCLQDPQHQPSSSHQPARRQPAASGRAPRSGGAQGQHHRALEPRWTRQSRSRRQDPARPQCQQMSQGAGTDGCALPGEGLLVPAMPQAGWEQVLLSPSPGRGQCGVGGPRNTGEGIFPQPRPRGHSGTRLLKGTVKTSFNPPHYGKIL